MRRPPCCSSLLRSPAREAESSPALHACISISCELPARASQTSPASDSCNLAHELIGASTSRAALAGAPLGRAHLRPRRSSAGAPPTCTPAPCSFPWGQGGRRRQPPRGPCLAASRGCRGQGRTPPRGRHGQDAPALAVCTAWPSAPAGKMGGSAPARSAPAASIDGEKENGLPQDR
ncbi:unnamed protein product [Urochloa humidicola]